MAHPPLNPHSSPGKKKPAIRRIVVVDDHPIIRHGMATLIHAEADFEVCAAVGDYHSGLAAVRTHHPDALLLDLGLPDVNGMELIKTLRAEQPSLVILVVSMQEESEYALRALRLGASGYIMKSDAIVDIVAGLRKTLQGEIFLSPTFHDRLIFQIISAPDSVTGNPVDRLTHRERDILDLIGQGLSTRLAAQRLNISIKTVETHRGHIKEKLNLNTSGELIRFALDWVSQRG